MKYPRFEALAFVLGSAIIVGTVAVRTTSPVVPAETIGGLLSILVLAGALHRGRNGGFVMALVATTIQVGMRYPALRSNGLSAGTVTAIASHTLVYAAIGVAGGELAGRVKYLLTRVDRDSMIDRVTRVYSARYAGRAIGSAMSTRDRYGTPCSAVTLTIAPVIWSGLRPPRAAAFMRRAASYLRNDVRLADDVAYRGNGGFVVIMPGTSRDGGIAAAQRLRHGLAAVLDCEADGIVTRVLECGADDPELEALIEMLAPTPAPGREVA